MKQIVLVTAILCVLAVAILGSLSIFEVMSYDAALSGLLKTVSAVVLLGGCSALIMFLVRSKK